MGVPETVVQAGIGMWIPCLMLSHAWAIYFICKAVAVLNPVLWKRLKAKLTRTKGP
jgi:hypothetical protein